MLRIDLKVKLTAHEAEISISVLFLPILSPMEAIIKSPGMQIKYGTDAMYETCKIKIAYRSEPRVQALFLAVLFNTAPMPCMV